MTASEAAIVAGLVAAVLAHPFTLAAMAIARRTGFLDRPYGYKAHRTPTPYLGGSAVIGAAILAAVLLGGLEGKLGLIAALAGGLWAVGTLDDRVGGVDPLWRIAASLLAGGALWALGLGWTVFHAWPLDLTLTLAWVLGLVNAHNLMDNLDGATATVAAVSATGIGALALVNGEGQIAVLAFALAGACAGFLRFNLAGPARIFLGDGGSMPIGFLVAALALRAADARGLSGAEALLGAMLVGLVILDTTLVVISRRRRRIPWVTAGRDHLTHRVLAQTGSPRRVALVLAFGQAGLCAGAIASSRAGAVPTAVLALGWVCAGVATIVVLESARFSPEAPHAPPVGVAHETRVLESHLADYNLPGERSTVSALDVVSDTSR